MGKANTKDSYEALLDTMRSSSIVFDVFCGIGDYDNGCKEFIEAYRGNIRSFRAEDTEDQLKSRGWLYRYDPDQFGPSQWACPSCRKK